MNMFTTFFHYYENAVLIETSPRYLCVTEITPATATIARFMGVAIITPDEEGLYHE